MDIKNLIAKKVIEYKPWPIISYICRMPGMTSLIHWIFYNCFSGPKAVKIHITNKCNYRCVYCYSDKYNNLLPTSVWVDFIDQLKIYNIQTIEISGGEPFLHKDLFKILKKCSDNDYKIIIYTNGSIIDEKIIKKIKSLNTQIIISVKYDHYLTYNKKTNSKYRLDSIEKNIRLLVKNNIPVVTFITVTKDNVKFIKYILNRAIELGTFPVVEKYVRLKDEITNESLAITAEEWLRVLKLIMKIYSNYRLLIDGIIRVQGGACSCYRTQVSIMQNGNVLPCQFLPPSISFGNIKTDSFNKIWGRIEKERKEWMKIPLECKNCNNKEICRGGCITSSYYKYNDFSRKDPLCCSNLPLNYGHCAFMVIHSFDNWKVENNKLVRLK